MAGAFEEDAHEAIARCDFIVAKVLTQHDFVRHIRLQRGLIYIFNILDWGVVPSLTRGTPMVGHVVWAFKMLSRNKRVSSCTVQEVCGKSKQNNSKMIGQAIPTGDITFDEGA